VTAKQIRLDVDDMRADLVSPVTMFQNGVRVLLVKGQKRG
jgi:hypothetical protein